MSKLQSILVSWNNIVFREVSSSSSTIPAIRNNKIKIEIIKSHSVLNFQQKIHPESKEKATSQKKEN